MESPAYFTYPHWQRLPASTKQTARRFYEELDALIDLKTQVESDLAKELHRHPIARILETVPGLGPIRVARLLPIVITPYRFRRRQQFWKYCGLGIVMRFSSDWVQARDGRWIWAPVQQTRGLNRRHNPVLKDIFEGAAMTVIARAPKDSLYDDYQRIVEAGTKPNLALVMSECAVHKMYEAFDAQELAPYCNFFDVTYSRSMGMGLDATHTIGLGCATCTLAYRVGRDTRIPERLVGLMPDAGTGF